jgi:hypothetical protein
MGVMAEGVRSSNRFRVLVQLAAVRRCNFATDCCCSAAIFDLMRFTAVLLWVHDVLRPVYESRPAMSPNRRRRLCGAMLAVGFGSCGDNMAVCSCNAPATVHVSNHELLVLCPAAGL